MLNDNQLAKALKLRSCMHWKDELLFILKQLRIPQEAYLLFFLKSLCVASTFQSNFPTNLSLYNC